MNPFNLLMDYLNKDPNYWGTQIFWCEILAVVLIAGFSKAHIILKSAFILFFAYGVYCLKYKFFPFLGASGASFQSDFQSENAISLLFLVAACLPFLVIDKFDLPKVKNIFCIFAVLDSMFMVSNYFHGGHATGLIGMDSIDGSFLVCIWPLIVKDLSNKQTLKASPLIAIFALAILLTKSSTVFGVLCLQILALLIFHKKYLLAAFSSLLSLPLGKLYLGHELLNSNGRQQILEKTLSVFKAVHPWALGFGTSSFIVAMPKMQDTHTAYFAFLHNEPVQVLFEQGLIGLLILCVVYGLGLFKQRDNFPMVLCLLAAGFQSFLQPCFRYLIFALFLAFLTRLSFEDETQFS